MAARIMKMKTDYRHCQYDFIWRQPGQEILLPYHTTWTFNNFCVITCPFIPHGRQKGTEIEQGLIIYLKDEISSNGSIMNHLTCMKTVMIGGYVGS